MKDKKILAIDTSDKICSVAISDDNKIVAKRAVGNKLSHSETLMPFIESAFNEALFGIDEVDYIFVVDGPGSFTGIRIGVATAKALAHFKKIPIVTVKSLDVIASLVEREDTVIVPLIDARRMTFYTRFFDSNFKNEISEIHHLEFSEILEKVSVYNKKVCFVGDNISKIISNTEINIDYEIIDTQEVIDRAERIAEISDYIFCSPESYLTAKPYYLKKSQAEREYDEKHGNGVK